MIVSPSSKANELSRPILLTCADHVYIPEHDFVMCVRMLGMYHMCVRVCVFAYLLHKYIIFIYANLENRQTDTGKCTIACVKPELTFDQMFA